MPLAFASARTNAAAKPNATAPQQAQSLDNAAKAQQQTAEALRQLAQNLAKMEQGEALRGIICVRTMAKIAVEAKLCLVTRVQNPRYAKVEAVASNAVLIAGHTNAAATKLAMSTRQI